MQRVVTYVCDETYIKSVEGCDILNVPRHIHSTESCDILKVQRVVAYVLEVTRHILKVPRVVTYSKCRELRYIKSATYLIFTIEHAET